MVIPIGDITSKISGLLHIYYNHCKKATATSGLEGKTMLDSNFTQQRVFVVGQDSLFEEGITRILERADILVSHAKFSDELTFLNTVKQDLPDVILVCESFSIGAARILDLVSEQAMMSMLVVVIRLHNNTVDIYGRSMNVAGKTNSQPQRIIVETGNDLLNAVSGRYTR